MSFTGVDATSYTVDSDTQISAVAPAHVAAATHVRVRTPGGTTASTTADTYTYRPAPEVTELSTTTGPLAGGNTITLKGVGFTGTTSIQVGTTTTSDFTVTQPRRIKLTLPPSPTSQEDTVHIRVTGPRGTSPTTPADTYIYRAAPTITDLSTHTGPTTGGSGDITITGTGFTGATRVVFAGTPAPHIIDSPTQISATTPPRPEGVTHVYVTTPGGTSTPSRADRYLYFNP